MRLLPTCSTLEFLQFNDAAAENLGYTREEFAKLTVHDIDPVYTVQQLTSVLRSDCILARWLYFDERNIGRSPVRCGTLLSMSVM